MARIKQMTDASGAVVYKVTVSDGRQRRITRSWRPEPAWGTKTIERELNRFAVGLELQLKNGELRTQQEQKEENLRAELEAAKIKSFGQYATDVYLATKSISLSKSAMHGYRQFLRCHILPVFAKYPITDITPAMIRKFLTDFQIKGYAHSSTIKLYVILNGIFQSAYLDDSIPVNPMSKVPRPKPRKDEAIKDEQSKAYTVAQLRYILQCMDSEPLKWRAYIALLADTGMRRGEACGLQWPDFDFNEETVTIRRNLLYNQTDGVYLDSPKNGHERVVDIGTGTIALLKQLQREQASIALSRYVFTQDGSAEPMHPQTPTRYFSCFGKKYKIKNFHPHKLRHTSASIAITNGADIVSVSQRLGHSDASVTLKMYAHANKESIRRAGDIVRQALLAQNA